MQHNLQDFLRRGGSGQYVVTRRNGTVYGHRADMSIKSLLPGYADMRAAFTDQLRPTMEAIRPNRFSKGVEKTQDDQGEADAKERARKVEEGTKRLIQKCHEDCGHPARRDFVRLLRLAKAKQDEYKSWVDNDVFELVDLRKVKCRNFVRGRWVLTVKRDKDGNFLKCKARWVLQGYLDKQKDVQQTDSPTSSRPGFRMACQFAANGKFDLYHLDLRTAFLQG
jgi:hypothetical protein